MLCSRQVINVYSTLRRSCLLPSPVCSKFGDCSYFGIREFVDSSNSGPNPKERFRKKYYNQFAILGSALTTCGLLYYFVKHKRHVLSASTPIIKAIQTVQPGEFIPGLPYYSLKEVAEHDEKKCGIWVTYCHGVYDITLFVERHPGGERIIMAAGGSLEPFWHLYAVHKKPDVLSILEEYRIGNLSPEDISETTTTDEIDDPYGLDPLRHRALRPSSIKPFNAETPLALLADNFITPTELFYVRNHLPVPDIDIKTYKLEIRGTGVQSQSLTLDELKTKFPKYTITASIQCAGNRRSEMTKVKAVKGLNWGQAAIGNATWSGARLCDVLNAAGYKEDTMGTEHVQLEGLDEYGASIPIEKAVDPRGDVLLAYEMNGEPLTRDHGFPVRAIVPGVTGARNVKWLGDVVLSKEESSSHWQQNDYKGFSPNVDWDTVDFSKSPAIQNLPVTSAICQPENGDKVRLADGYIRVKGYAWSGGGQKIVRVDVSANGGKSWHTADLKEQDDIKPPRHWGWTLWQADILIPSGTKQVELCCKAIDSSYNTQPENFENIWNLRGVLSNAYHRIKVDVTK